MQIIVDSTLIEAARHLAPVIRAHRDEAERARRLVATGEADQVRAFAQWFRGA